MSSNGERLNVNFKISKKILGKKFLPRLIDKGISGRGSRTRTCGLTLPKRAL